MFSILLIDQLFTINNQKCNENKYNLRMDVLREVSYSGIIFDS